MTIRHTSRATIGQVYFPGINLSMMMIVILLVVSFGSSSNLATAYGISVSGTMLIDTLLLALVARAPWPTWRWWVLPCCLLFLVGDIAVVIANGATILPGGWFQLALAIVLFPLLRPCTRGREPLREANPKGPLPPHRFLPTLVPTGP